MFIKSVLSGTQQGAKVFDAEYLVIAGGGGGGCDGAGGGAGGYRSSVTGESSGGGASAEATFTASFNTAYTVTVGAGGAGSTTTSVKGTSGTDTVFNTVTSAGGGGGASRDAIDGLTGGSGGGAGGIPGGSVGAGTANQGFAGGLAYNGGLASGYGGGGGADQVGQNAGASLGGDGGDGVESYITGSAIYRAGGGGGGHGDGSPPGGTGGTGGLGGGGNGSSLNVLATAGAANTGGAGGGGGRQGGYVNGAAGGSGVVIIRVPSSVVAEFSAGVVYNYIPLDDFNVYEVTAAGVSDTVTFSQGALATIDDSLRFNDDDTAYLSRTPASAGNRKTWTWAGWVKLSKVPSVQASFFNAKTGSGNANTGIDYSSPGPIRFVIWNGSGTDAYLPATQVFRDFSAWYHLVVAFDTTQATASDRVKMYINGSQITNFSTLQYPSQNYEAAINLTQEHNIGRNAGTGVAYLDSYLADVYFIDGQALDPSRFGKQDADGVWQPISYTGTYGTNGFHLDFADNSTAAALGTDVSGNGNDWTPSGITTDDQVSDTPSVNYATWNAVSIGADSTLSDGNLKIAYGTSATRSSTTSTVGMKSGKWYWEIEITASSVVNTNAVIGISSSSSASALPNYPGFNALGWGYDGSAGDKYHNGSGASYGAVYGVGDVIGVAFDADTGDLEFYKNNASQGVAYTGLTDGPYFPAIGDGSATNTFTAVANFGQRPFTYTPPTGFQALNSANLPAPVIADGKEHFGTVLWNATGTQSVQGLEFQPDFLWLKVRSTSGSHHLMDAVRGAANFLQSDTTDAETNSPTFLTSFDSSGFSFGSNNWSDGRSMVGWNWNAGGSTVTNTDGTITSQVRANTDAGFSIVGYTGTGSVATVGHGLDSAPEMVIVKSRDDGSARWVVWHTGLSGGTYDLGLNNTDAEVSNASRFNGLPTSTIFNIGTGGLVNDTENYIAYCFHSVDGFSKFGSYTGNGSTDGPFVYTGFRPAFVMVKRTDVANDWDIRDTSRNPYNIGDKILFPNRSDAETTNAALHIDINSNGFKVRGTGNQNNASGGTYIYMAFAENPFKTARAR